MMHGARGWKHGGSDGPKKKLSLDRVWSEARLLVIEHRKRLALGLVLLLISRAAGFVLPFTTKPFLDEVIGKSRYEILPWLVGAAGAATLIQAATSFALSQILGVAAQGAINDLRKRVHAHLLRLPVRWFDDRQSGQLISRVMNDAEGVRNLVGNGLVQLIGSLVTAACALSVLFWLDWKLTLVVTTVLAIFGVFMAWSFGTLRPLFRERGRITAEVSGRLGEALGGIRVVKAYAAEGRERATFAAGADRLFDNVRRSITGVSATTALATAAFAVVATAMMLVGGNAVMHGRMTPGDLLMYAVFTGLLAMPITQMASIGTQITEAFAGLDRIREILNETPEDAADASLPAMPVLRGDLEFSNVSFTYREAGPWALEDVSFAVPAGATVALVGHSGSGKSTLAALVLAFHRPTRGRILVDGQDIAGLPLAGYRSQLGVVQQDTVLFDATLADNIAYARPDASRERIAEAARLAYCQEFAAGLPQGFDTIVGERGVKLSGGQRQRVAIARALIAEPRILILDEATSHLDVDSEAAIQGALAELRRGRTTLVIAHRLSTIRSADLILVLDHGRVVERGTHTQLLEQGGLYRRLHERQAGDDHYLNPGEEPR